MTDPTETDQAIARVRRALAGKAQPELDEFLDDVRVLSDLLTPGILALAVERRRQITAEGYTPEHDAGHADDLFAAAARYGDLASLLLYLGEQERELRPLVESQGLGYVTAPGSATPVPFGWPALWPWKPADDPARNAEKAGALLAAGLDSLLAEQGPTKEN